MFNTHNQDWRQRGESVLATLDMMFERVEFADDNFQLEFRYAIATRNALTLEWWIDHIDQNWSLDSAQHVARIEVRRAMHTMRVAWHTGELDFMREAILRDLAEVKHQDAFTLIFA